MANTEAFGNQGIVDFSLGPYKSRILDHDGPASYPTGGETITAISLGFKRILSVTCSGSDTGAQFCAIRFSAKKAQTSFKLQWYVNTTGAEVANAVDLSARFCRLHVIGV